MEVILLELAARCMGKSTGVQGKQLFILQGGKLFLKVRFLRA